MLTPSWRLTNLSCDAGGAIFEDAADGDGDQSEGEWDIAAVQAADPVLSAHIQQLQRGPV